ncbi:hypothetical protein BEP19_04630 [Ammoniphilus oxalaticus]|uniref:methylmalonyl-CoA mutase n=1 Tax=Ammoniphilus oxalaticus TaxID=66863 RepID=A0A419SM16_9BACL|nr:methylmalonyl-CoA mutase family protein [Ammoniphilus oxalaticus]RKD25109.1 hypothetical protein BEP19_04630 [Ammoniphilus oxalaticus]
MVRKEEQAGRQKRLTLDEFPIPDYKDWLKAVEKSLKGKSSNSLTFKTYEQIELKTIYSKTDGEALTDRERLMRSASLENRWEVSQQLAESDPQRFAAIAADAFKQGQTTLRMQWACPHQLAETVSQKGLNVSNLVDLETALEKIKWEQVPIFVQAGAVSFPTICFLAALAKKQRKDFSIVQGCIGADPFSEWVRRGTLPISTRRAFDQMAETIRWTQTHAPALKTICIQSTPYHDGGANAIQELAFMLATAVDYIRALLKRGLTIDPIASQIQFSISIGSSFFTEIAKLRAARLLWARIIEVFGGTPTSQRMVLHAQTSFQTKTLLDPHVNILRATTEAYAAIIGGANSLHVCSFNEATDPQDKQAQRIARNTQLILDHEAHGSKVIDPAGGSWYIESLTDTMAQRAWQLFQQVEQLGGMQKALLQRFPQQEIAKMAEDRKRNAVTSIDHWIGVNVYPNLNEIPRNDHTTTTYKSSKQSDALSNQFNKLKQQIKRKPTAWLNLMLEATLNGLTLYECYEVIDIAPPELTIQPIRPERPTASFENLRLAAAHYREKTGSWPRALLLKLGVQAKHQRLAVFSEQFLGIGGFEAVSSENFSTVEQAMNTIHPNLNKIVVICAAPKIEPLQIAHLARHLKSRNPDLCLLMAGLPAKEDLERFRQAGIDDFIHDQMNNIELLMQLQRKKGIRS